MLFGIGIVRTVNAYSSRWSCFRFADEFKAGTALAFVTVLSIQTWRTSYDRIRRVCNS